MLLPSGKLENLPVRCPANVFFCPGKFDDLPGPRIHVVNIQVNEIVSKYFTVDIEVIHDRRGAEHQCLARRQTEPLDVTGHQQRPRPLDERGDGVIVEPGQLDHVPAHDRRGIEPVKHRIVRPAAPPDDDELRDLIGRQGLGEMLPDIEQKCVVLAWLDRAERNEIGF